MHSRWGISECSCPPRYEGDPSVECTPKACQSESDCAWGAFCDFERSKEIADAVASTIIEKEKKEEEEKSAEGSGEDPIEEEKNAAKPSEEDNSSEDYLDDSAEGSGEEDAEAVVVEEETEEEKERRLEREEAEKKKLEEEKERLKQEIASKGECKCPEDYVGNPYVFGCREGEIELALFSSLFDRQKESQCMNM